EHLLLGVFREGSEGVAALLRGAGLDVEQAYREVESHLPRRTDGAFWVKLPLTPGAKRALQYALHEALTLHHRRGGPGHPLAGALQDPDSTAAQILVPLGLAADRLRDELAKLPEPENRDWMLRSQPVPGTPILADPSPRDLQAVVTEEVLPPAV